MISKISLPAGVTDLVDPVTGIITDISLSDIEMSDPEIFEVVATLCDMSRLYGSGTTRTAGVGVGIDLSNALGAAIGEAIESYAISIVDRERLIFGSADQLSKAGHIPFPPGKWSLFDRSQYRDIRFSPFDKKTKISWVEARDLVRKKKMLVPASLVYLTYDSPFRERGEELIYINNTTGAACGSTYDDAILKAICEIVERDAFIIMWRNRLPMTRVLIDRESDLYELFEQKFRKPGLAYYLIYTKLDLNIPSFFGILIDYRRGFPSINVAGAAHPDPEIAAVKTLLELVQGFRYKNYLPYQRFDAGYKFRNIRSFEDRIRLYAFNDLSENVAFLTEHEDEISLSSISSIDKGDTGKNLRNILSNLAENKLDVLAVDVTPNDIRACGLSVVRVLIPQSDGIESDHNTPLLGGNRWRVVPFKLGFLPSKSDIGSINHLPHPYP